MALQTFKRYEDKFLLDRRQYEALLKRLGEFMDFDSHCRDGTYKICNIYFDTVNNDIIRLSTSKPYYKEKLRLRSYGTPENDNAKVFLELKKKIGGVVNKRRVVMTYGEAKKYLENGERPVGANQLSLQVLNEIDWFLRNNPVKPAAYISYDRVAMFAKDNPQFRLTFDSNIETRRTDLSLGAGSYGEQLLEPDTFLMEIKIADALPLHVARILSEEGAYSRGFSKFGTEFKHYLLSKKAEKEAIAI